MKTTHNGKIGRLPMAVQEEVNRRLENGEKGRAMAAWLNALPEVRAVLAAEFAGKPIREQNLSQWRRGGYREWLWRREALELAPALAKESAALQAAGAPPLTDQMAGWVAVRYLMAVRKLAEANGAGGAGLKVLRGFCRDIVALRRGEQRGARLKSRTSAPHKAEAERRRRKGECEAGGLN